jgi:adenylosuccinate lyase
VIDRYSTPEMKTLWSEAKKYQIWLEIELAATEAWEALGEVPQGTTARIRESLKHQELDEAFANRVAEIEAVTKHDIVAFTRALSEKIGDDARFIHLGLTSTDVVDSAQNLILRQALDFVLKDVQVLQTFVKEKAITYKHTPCIGRTHGIHAEPMTFGLKFLNFYAALLRDEKRLRQSRESINVLMLSGSVGTYAHVPPEIEKRVAEKLDMTVDPVTNQTVARDRHAELLSSLAILGTTLERIALEVRHLQRSEVREAQEGFSKGQTGSSSMPHKKNPIATENITGIARLLRSNLQAALENVALWHERDISHSSTERVILPDTTTLASYATRRLTNVVQNLMVYPENMQKNLDSLHGLIYSQRVLHKLIDKGIMREVAYEVVQRNSLKSWETGTHLKELLQQDPDNPLTPDELSEAFNPDWYLRYIDDIFARFAL